MDALIVSNVLQSFDVEVKKDVEFTLRAVEVLG